VAVLVPVVKAVLEEFVPSAADAGEAVRDRVVLVDGTIAPCWSYRKHEQLRSGKARTTGFNAQLVCLLGGEAVYVSDPLPGKTHDFAAFSATPVAEIVRSSGGGIGDKGYQGTSLITPRKKPWGGGELSRHDKACNREISALRAPVEQSIPHFKLWRIFHADYRRPYHTYRDAHDAGRALFFFSTTWSFE
jgi:hypothetical protein